MGKKDWSHLRNEHKSRFAKRQLEEETSLVKKFHFNQPEH